MLPKWHKKLAISWLIVNLLLLIMLSWLFSHSRINSSIIAMLPKEQMTGLPSNIVESFNQRLDKQLVWLIRPVNNDVTAIKVFLEQLTKLPEVTHVFQPIDEKQQAKWGAFLYQYRSALMDDTTKARLKQGASNYSEWVKAQLYSPFAGVGVKELSYDPLLLIRSAQLAQQAGNSHFQLKDGWLTVTDKQGQLWYFIYAELTASSYDIKTAKQTISKLQQLKNSIYQQWPDTQILQRGMIYYSDYASQQAEQDIFTIGIVSVIGIVLLLLVFFRSFRPLIIIMVAVIIGILCGTVAVLLVFEQVHIITLLMSTTVICLAIDYALFYLSERMMHGNQETPFTSLIKLLPCISLAMIASCIAYAVLLLTPFPGLRQLALFAVFGLLGAFITVFCWFPYLVKNFLVRQVKLTFPHLWLNLWQQNRIVRIGIPTFCVVASLIGISQLTINDDISNLQSLPTQLKEQDQKISQLTGQQGDQKWFVVYGETAEQALERLQLLKPTLTKLQEQGAFTSYRLLPLSSLKNQQQNIDLLSQQAPDVIKQLEALGLKIASKQVATNLLKPSDWLASVISEGWRLLWFDNQQGQTAILVPVSGVKNTLLIKALVEETPYLYWMDKRTEYNQLFATYRYYLAWLILVATAIICALFLIRFKWRHGLYCIVPTILSLAMGIAMLGLCAIAINLFSLLALVLVLGVGIDYTLFFSNSRVQPTTSMISISLAAITTLLTFGLLALSHTAAIADFGMVLTTGILTAFLLSPIAIPKGKL